MYLFFIKILFLFCVYDSCRGTESDDILNKNESTFWSGSLAEFLQEGPAAVVIELREPLLEKVKGILTQESDNNFPVQGTTLATFDSMGLRDVSTYNNTPDIREAILDLQPTADERQISTPTIRVLGELLQKEMLEGVVLLVTMSRPSDEFFTENLMRSLMGKRCQVSILWGGNYESDEYLLLKDVAERSGGKFGYITNENNSDENASEETFPYSQLEKFAEKIKFPDQNETTEDIPMVSRAAEQKAAQRNVVPLIIEVASGTTLETRPGVPTQIQFTVKNNLNALIQVGFTAKFNGVLQNVQPHRALLQAAATLTVIVNLYPLGGAQSANAVGTLTLMAEIPNRVISRSAIISLAPQTERDNYAPKMTYKYNGDCSNYREPQNCDQGQWGLEATFHDEDSGLLKVLSEPYGLLFQTEFVAGTKTPVSVYYSATCCQPHVVIWAEDLKGNYVRKSFDVFNQALLAGEIAGIVLGVLLLLFLIIAVIVGVIFYKKRNQRNMIIPRARSGSR